MWVECFWMLTVSFYLVTQHVRPLKRKISLTQLSKTNNFSCSHCRNVLPCAFICKIWLPRGFTGLREYVLSIMMKTEIWILKTKLSYISFYILHMSVLTLSLFIVFYYIFYIMPLSSWLWIVFLLLFKSALRWSTCLIPGYIPNFSH